MADCRDVSSTYLKDLLSNQQYGDTMNQQDFLNHDSAASTYSNPIALHYQERSIEALSQYQDQAPQYYCATNSCNYAQHYDQNSNATTVESDVQTEHNNQYSPTSSNESYLLRSEASISPVRNDVLDMILDLEDGYITENQQPNHLMYGAVNIESSNTSVPVLQSTKLTAKGRPKTFQCIACNKWYACKGHLIRHYKSHAHEIPNTKGPMLSDIDCDYSAIFDVNTNTIYSLLNNSEEKIGDHTEFNYDSLLAALENNKENILDDESSNKSKSHYMETSLTPSENNQLTEKNISDIKIKCNMCDKQFQRRSYLIQHNKAHHSGDMPFRCAKCGKKYRDIGTYEEHVSRHNDTKPHKCPECPKSFNHKTDLRRHMCSHSIDRPHVCHICNKGFVRNDHLVKHIERHVSSKVLKTKGHKKTWK